MTLTSAQTALRDGKLLIAQTFPIGGSLWDVSGVTGDDLTTPKTATDVGTVRLWVRKIQPTRLEIALANIDAPRARWSGTGELGAAEAPADVRADALTAGQTLTSQEDDSYVFLIKDVDLDAGYVSVILEAQR